MVDWVGRMTEGEQDSMKQMNYLLINRKAQTFKDVTMMKSGLAFRNADGNVLNHGVLVMNSNIRACLYCDEVRNLTFLVAGSGEYDIVTAIFGWEDTYLRMRDAMRNYPRLQLSPQSRKINRYAERLLEKLKRGEEIRVIDEVRKEDVVICPECGVQCQAGTPYCMECGAELPH